jgi:hypothetical protein
VPHVHYAEPTWTPCNRLLGPYVQLSGINSKQWGLIKAWMQAMLQGSLRPHVSLEEAMDLIPVAHKVC